MTIPSVVLYVELRDPAATELTPLVAGWIDRSVGAEGSADQEANVRRCAEHLIAGAFARKAMGTVPTDPLDQLPPFLERLVQHHARKRAAEYLRREAAQLGDSSVFYHPQHTLNAMADEIAGVTASTPEPR